MTTQLEQALEREKQRFARGLDIEEAPCQLIVYPFHALLVR